MPETADEVVIPERAFFKPSEVCELAKVQPYVLRSWEAEFKDLGVPRTGGGGRVYRRVDVERVLRIKHLLLVDGLTLAGVRRKLEEEREPPIEEQVVLEPQTLRMTDAAKERIGAVKSGLRSLLTLLDTPLAAATVDGGGPALDFALAPASTEARAAVKSPKRASSKAASKTASPEGVCSS
ncbi:MAG: MerR family transcriptional regulator [Vicinamibacterales bacterium]